MYLWLTSNLHWLFLTKTMIIFTDTDSKKFLELVLKQSVILICNIPTLSNISKNTVTPR